MTPSRIALPLLLAAALTPALERWLRRPAPIPAGCPAEGRGIPPRHWMACATDPGPRRDLTGAERLLQGLPLDPNRASAEELALLPGLSYRLARELVAERERAGPYASVDDLERVRGIGPARRRKAAPHLRVEGAEGR